MSKALGSRIFKYSPQQVYNVVADVGAYSSWLPYVTRSKLNAGASQTNDTVEAQFDIAISKGFPISTSFSAQITRTPCQKIWSISKSSSPWIKQLETTWTFDKEPRTTVTLQLMAQLGPYAAPFIPSSEKILSRGIHRTLDLFEKRCEQLYSHDQTSS